jgi:hypothetical protein
MSEGKNFVERTITADPNRFKPAPEPEEKLSDYQKKIRRDREKKQQEARQRQSRVSAIDEFNRQDIASVKNILDITPSKPVPEGMNPFLPTPMELERGTHSERTYSSDGTALDFKLEEDNLVFDEIDLNEKLPEEKGGRKRKLRKSKKSRKSKRKTTRKNRRHRRRH